MVSVYEEKGRLLDGYKEIIELVENNIESDGIYSSEEVIEKVLEISDRKVNGEV